MLTTDSIDRSLTVYALAGVSNRLKVLVSGLAVAAATQRRFRMLWPLNAECGAGFRALFANDWDVVDVAAADVAPLPYVVGWVDQLPDLLAVDDQDVLLGHDSWLLRPGRFDGHGDLMARSIEYFAQLAPIPVLEDRIVAFKRSYFRSRMIGVHLRRGDFLRARPDVAGGTEKAIAAVDNFLEQWPDAGVLLCTDDGAPDPRTGAVRTEGVAQRFADRVGERLVQDKVRSLDRSRTAAIQDAVVDLWLLKCTDGIVGTAGSTFTKLALLGRVVPYTLIAEPTAPYGRFRRVARVIGANRMWNALRQRGLVRTMPFPALVDYYYRAAARIIGRPGVANRRRIDGQQR
ncbi:MAG: hypothetical protein IPK16_16330 [Anaerolineales bacterium]|nr:hypothetical protein [Anaerolineales bacterium]